jgi:hypothetical protein
VCVCFEIGTRTELYNIQQVTIGGGLFVHNSAYSYSPFSYASLRLYGF